MKKALGLSILFVGMLCLVFFAGLFVGRSSIASVPEVVRTQTPSVATTPSDVISERININTADSEQLQKLPGIGEVLAQRIIDYRTANGPFKSILHLQNVDGIGSKTLDNIMELICLEDTK